MAQRHISLSARDNTGRRETPLHVCRRGDGGGAAAAARGGAGPVELLHLPTWPREALLSPLDPPPLHRPSGHARVTSPPPPLALLP
jgi:hypothetical protein